VTPPAGYRGPHDPQRDHWPSQPLVDGRALQLLERWAQALAILAARLDDAEHGAAYGHGQADLRTWQRGGDPVAGRLDWDPPGPDDPDRTPPPRIADPEKRRLLKLRDGTFGRLAYDLDWFERQLRPPQQEAGWS
jgi:hypothetical protein